MMKESGRRKMEVDEEWKMEVGEEWKIKRG
jgi:hypothetical protein